MTNNRIKFFLSLHAGSGILSSSRGYKQVHLRLCLRSEGHRFAIFIIIDRFGSREGSRDRQRIFRIF